MITLYVDTGAGQLITGLSSQSLIDPTSLPLYAGDTGLTMNVYLLAPLPSAPQGSWPYSVILPSSILLCNVQIDNGQFGAGVGQTGNAYTSQNAWVADPTNQFLTATFMMNAPNMTAQFTSGVSSLSAFLRIGYNSLTALAQRVIIKPGVPGLVTQVPVPLTPLSVQQAQNQFVPIGGGAPGQGFYLTTPNGHKLYVQAIDNPDGVPTLQSSPSS